MGRKPAVLRDNHRRRGEKMKSHIAGSTMTSKTNVQTAIAHSEMQQVVAVYRICTALALNKLYGFGNERLKKFNEAVEESLVEFGRYAGSTGISKARGFTDLETGEEMLMQAVRSRGIDIEYTLGIKALEV